MLFKLHYFLQNAGWCASTVLLGVFVKTYTDASPLEIGGLFMSMPFVSIVARPMISSAADRSVAHRKYFMVCLTMVAICQLAIVTIPFLGPNIYETHARVCWYFIASMKTTGDVAMSGAMTLGDALAMNYARRLGTQFMVYRVWGTIGWMSVGLIIGQINEVSFLPRYTPAFLIMAASFLLDTLIIWLWPDEYLKMIPLDQMKIEQEQRQAKGHKSSHLLPRDVVLAHMGDKICGLFCCTSNESANQAESVKVIASGDNLKVDLKTQIRILFLLLRRDPRVILYLLVFTCLGFMISPFMFLFVGMAERCQDEFCNFSQIASLLQVSTASTETLIFMFIKPIERMFGRLSILLLSALLACLEFTIYTLYWYTMNPYLVIVTSCLRGVYFASAIVLTTSMAFVFANEVKFLLPELRSKGVINDNSEAYTERLKLSLSATMQAITTASSEGLGRGLGALLCGLVIESYSYQMLWLMLSLVSAGTAISCLMVKLFDAIFSPKLGLDVKAEQATSP